MNRWMVGMSILAVTAVLFIFAGSRDASAATHDRGDFSGTLLLVRGGGGGGGGHGGGHGGMSGSRQGSSRDGFERMDNGEAHNGFRGSDNRGRDRGLEIENEFEFEHEIEIEHR